MQNFSTLPISRKCLICQLPHCNCEKCKKLRSEYKPDQQSIRKQCSKLGYGGINEEPLEKVNVSVNEKATLNKIIPNKSKRNLFTIPSFTMPTFNFTPSSFEAVLFDIVGVASFFVMGSLIFWLTVSQYLWCFGKMVLQSGRMVKLLTLTLILLLFVSITIHAIKGKHKHRSNILILKKSSDPLQPQNSTTYKRAPNNRHKSCQHRKCFNFNSRNCKKINENLDKYEVKSAPSNSNLDKKKNPSLCDLCAKNLKAESSSQISLNDAEILGMFKRYKLYSVASEMKFPPSFTNIIEVLSGFYNGMLGSLAS